MPLSITQKAQIQTERLILKPHTMQDMDALADLLTNPEITRTFMVPDFSARADAEALARTLIAFSQPEDATHLEYGVYRAGELIGLVNNCGTDGDAIEIGYVIAPRHQGCGYATEAVRAVLADLHDMGFQKVIAGYFAENTASRRVMEKCGMHAIDRTDEVIYRGERHICRYCEICFG